ncbi:MAG: ATP-binding protein [Desulfobacterales bacterium]|nr:ATP-binding protein [Desulfobacterales bacterium]
MKNEFIETSRVTAFWEAVKAVSDMEKGHPGMMLAWGYAGRGKTECARTYATRNENAKYIRVFEDWTPRAMLSTICEELNGMKPGHIHTAKRIIIEEVDDSDKILLIDEADRLTVKHIEHLRDIHDETDCPIVLIGEPSIYTQIKSRTRIWRRFTQAVEFGPLLNEDIILFGLKNCGIRIAPEAARTLKTKSKGSFGFLIHYMTMLEGIATSNKIEDIGLDIVNGLPDDLLPKPKSERFLR